MVLLADHICTGDLATPRFMHHLARKDGAGGVVCEGIPLNLLVEREVLPADVAGSIDVDIVALGLCRISFCGPSQLCSCEIDSHRRCWRQPTLGGWCDILPPASRAKSSHPASRVGFARDRVQRRRDRSLERLRRPGRSAHVWSYSSHPLRWMLPHRRRSEQQRQSRSRRRRDSSRVFGERQHRSTGSWREAQLQLKDGLDIWMQSRDLGVELEGHGRKGG